MGLSVGVSDGTGVGEIAGFGAATAALLLQTNFLPDFIQVYVLPLKTLVFPAFLQLAPSLTA
jgi:hypothetical protein